MTSKQRKKRAVISSIVSMIVCFSMLVGMTMAWFTDTVTNNGNRIETGGIEVQLLKYDGAEYKDISNGEGSIFAADANWEPGKTEVVYLQVKNNGNLALNYNIVLNIENDEANTKKLNEVLTYAIVPGDYSSTPCASWKAITENSAVETDKVPEGETKAAEKGALQAGASDYFALAIHMNEDAGIEYEHHAINIDVKIVAKQMASEKDSFGDQYDAGAEYEKEKEEENTAPRGNLLVNPGFETVSANPSAPEGWTRRKGTWGETLSLDQSQHKEGNNSIKIGSFNGAALDQDIQWIGGKTYVVSGYFMVSQEMVDAQATAEAAARATVTITSFYNDGSSKKVNYVLYGTGSAKSPLVVENQSSVTANTWIPFSFEITADANSNAARIAPTEVVAGGVVWFDELCVIDKAEIPPAPVNMLVNPGFETPNAANTNVPDGWTRRKGAWGETLCLDQSQHKEGNNSIKVGSLNGAALDQDIQWTGGKTYVVSGYFMVSQEMIDAQTSTPAARAAITLTQFYNDDTSKKVNYVVYGNGSGSSPLVVTDQSGITANTWIPFSFEIEAAAKSSLLRVAPTEVVAGGVVWFDDLCVMEKVVTTE